MGINAITWGAGSVLGPVLGGFNPGCGLLAVDISRQSAGWHAGHTGGLSAAARDRAQPKGRAL